MKGKSPEKEIFLSLIKKGTIVWNDEIKDLSHKEPTKKLRTNYEKTLVNRLKGVLSETAFEAHFRKFSTHRIRLLSGGWFISSDNYNNPLSCRGCYLSVAQPADREAYQFAYRSLARGYKGRLLIAWPASQLKIDDMLFEKSFDDIFVLEEYSREHKCFVPTDSEVFKNVFRKGQRPPTPGSLSETASEICNELIDSIFQNFHSYESFRAQFFHRYLVDHYFRMNWRNGKLTDIDAILVGKRNIALVDVKLKFPSWDGKTGQYGFGQNNAHKSFFEELLEKGMKVLYVVNEYAPERNDRIMDIIPDVKPENWFTTNMRYYFFPEERSSKHGTRTATGTTGSNTSAQQDTTILPKQGFFWRTFRL